MLEVIANNHNSSLIMTAHKFSDFANIFNRIVIVKDGQILRDGHIREVLCEVPLFHELGLEIPAYVEMVYAAKKGGLDSAPLSLAEAVEMMSLSEQDAFKHKDKQKKEVDKKRKEDVLKVSHLSISAGKTNIIKDVSFNVQQGEIVSLLGYNGAGKSTLAFAIAGAVKPTSGSIEMFGEKLEYKRRRKKSDQNAKKVGYVFQYPEHQFLYESIEEEMMHGMDEKERNRALKEISSLNIDDPKKHPYELSGGEKRRLSVKSATMNYPDILILDEPTYGQDSHHREVIEQDILKLNQQGKTIFIISHDMDLVERLSTKVLVLRKGEKVFEGSPESLFNNDEIIKQNGLALPYRYELNRFISKEGKIIV